MSHTIRLAGGVFSAFHQELMGEPIDFSGLKPGDHTPELLAEAQETWQHRVHTEFRSVQIMNRFLTEVLGSGDPLDVYAGALDLVQDEVKHTALCAQVCEALGHTPHYPEPLALDDPPEFLRSPMPQRALATAISMVAISETLSVGFVSDLAARCTTPGIADVLQATVGDEEGHQEFGWTYIEQSLQRFPASTLDDWRHLVRSTLAPHFQQVHEILAEVPDEQQHLEAWPDDDAVALGLFTPPRQALVFAQTYHQELAPRLKALQLLDDDMGPLPPPLERSTP